VSAQAKRAQIAYAVHRGRSVRRACALLGVARSALGYESRIAARNEAVVTRLREIAEAHPRWGYRRAWAVLRRERSETGRSVNQKRVHRLWRAERLSVPTRRPRQKRPTGEHVTPMADRPNAVWTDDFVHDTCANGQALQCLTVVDESTKECLRIEVDGRLHSGRVITVRAELVAAYGAPTHLRSDNGPEFIAHAVQRWLGAAGIATAYIEPGKPWQNGIGERVNGSFRDECLDREWFHTRREARVVIEQYRRHYNDERPHSSVGSQTPAEAGASRARAAAVGTEAQDLTQRRRVS
jgi:putative transposase